MGEDDGNDEKRWTPKQLIAIEKLKKLNTQSRAETGRTQGEIEEAQQLSDKLAFEARERSSYFNSLQYLQDLMGYIAESMVFLIPKSIKKKTSKSDPTQYQQ